MERLAKVECNSKVFGFDSVGESVTPRFIAINSLCGGYWHPGFELLMMFGLGFEARMNLSLEEGSVIWKQLVLPIRFRAPHLQDTTPSARRANSYSHLLKGSSTPTVTTLRWRAAPLIFLTETVTGRMGCIPIRLSNVAFFTLTVTLTLGVNRA